MIAAWMLYALLVSALVAAAARLLDEVCRLRGAPTRWVWLGGLATTLVLVALAPTRVSAPAPATGDLVLPAAVVTSSSGGTTRLVDPAAILAAARELVSRPLRAAAALGEGRTGQALAVGWGALSLLTLALGGTALARAARARRAWPRGEISGVAVRVSPAVGPAVLGLRRPEVVVPGWLLAAPGEAQRLVVLHEREHIRARDPLTLAAGCLAVALLPWNPAAWWMLLRLRLAVELDCDTRVLRGGVRPRAYGALLIEMAGRGPGLFLGVPAMAGTPSTLERRLRAMTLKPARFAPARAGLLGLLGIAALAAACDTPMPTATDVQAMDASAARQQAVRLQLVNDTDMTYFIDGRQVTAAEANSLSADRIAQVEIDKTTERGGTMRITTAAPGAGNAANGGAELRIRGTRTVDAARSSAPGNDQVVVVRELAGGAEAPRLLRAESDTLPGGPTRIRVRSANGGGRDAPLIVLDGVVVEQSTLEALNPQNIDKIEVIKGAAATQQYSDPRAVHGVIQITTKQGAAPRP